MKTRIALLGLAGIVLALAVAVSSPRASECDPQCQALLSLTDLHSTVEELVPDQGLANSLLAKVDAATASVEALRTTPALNQLGAFDNEVAADERSGQTSTNVANVLKAKSDASKGAIQNIK
jgi:hypothetical protein